MPSQSDKPSQLPVSLKLLCLANAGYWGKPNNCADEVRAATDFAPACQALDIPVAHRFVNDPDGATEIPIEIRDQLDGKRFKPGMPISYQGTRYRIVQVLIIGPTAHQDPISGRDVLAVGLVEASRLCD